jgi:hypothetical protein
MTNEGYVLVATGTQKYFDLAARAAKSIRFFDRERGICLACDDESRISSESRLLFERVVRLGKVDLRKGTEHHLYLNQVSPFERTLYVDADCLLSNGRIHAIWEKFKSYHVTFPGRKLTEGTWRVDIAQIRERLAVDYVVQLNGGVFYFDRSSQSEEFFRVAQGLFETRSADITVKHNSGGGLANEPIWGVTMALTGAAIFPLSEHLNVSTLRTEKWAIESEPCIRLWKDNAVWLPVFCHFLGLYGPKCPNLLYNAFAALISSPESERPPLAK